MRCRLALALQTTPAMNSHDKNYTDVLNTILEEGERVPNRTGIDTISVLGMQHKYDLDEGFPVLAAKTVFWKKAIAETLWFLSGNCTNLDGLVQRDRDGNSVDARHIWRDWQLDDNGYLGPIYGYQWRHWKVGSSTEHEIDQLTRAVELLKTNPDCRRNIVTSWRVDMISDMALPPCHVMFQFSARNGYLHLHLYQRSCDVPIGVPFNIVGYATILAVVAKLTGLKRGKFIHTMHDAHVYVNQIDGVQKILANAASDPRPMPDLIIHGKQETLDDFKLADFELINYDPHPFVKIPVAV